MEIQETNMGMTIENVLKKADKPASTVGEAASILAKGLLMGAREQYQLFPRIFTSHQNQRRVNRKTQLLPSNLVLK